ncbi:hypothetical protein [Nitrobacter sp. JJSN]|uniref:hypothetical protein n=1 Tax=Nitrobacter sp. JJSN TaxID=3453033 RepID=UPI003F76AEB9
MTKFKTTDLAGQIRVLDDAELTAVSGGAFELPENLRTRRHAGRRMGHEGCFRQVGARHLSDPISPDG